MRNVTTAAILAGVLAAGVTVGTAAHAATPSSRTWAGVKFTGTPTARFAQPVDSIQKWKATPTAVPAGWVWTSNPNAVTIRRF